MYTYDILIAMNTPHDTDTTPTPRVAAIILAAGASRRMGTPKALLTWRGATFLTHCINTARAARCHPLICVTHPDAEELRRTHADAPVTWCENPTPQHGMLSSLRCGLMCMPPSVDAALLCLIDHPSVAPETFQALCAHAARTKICVPTFNATRGHPVVFGADFFPLLCEREWPDGARGLLRAYAAHVEHVAVDDPEIHRDIDTPARYAALQEETMQGEK